MYCSWRKDVQGLGRKARPKNHKVMETVGHWFSRAKLTWLLGSFVPTSLICILQSKKHKFASTICPQYCIWELSLWSAKAPMIAAIPPVFATLAKRSRLHFCRAKSCCKCTVKFPMAFMASYINTKQQYAEKTCMCNLLYTLCACS